MITDTELKVKGMNVLTKHLGLVDSEKFIYLLHKDKLDYTAWRSSLFKGLKGEEISAEAMKFISKNTQKTNL